MRIEFYRNVKMQPAYSPFSGYLEVLSAIGQCQQYQQEAKHVQYGLAVNLDIKTAVHSYMHRQSLTLTQVLTHNGKTLTSHLGTSSVSM